jgi:hypothetical protein
MRNATPATTPRAHTHIHTRNRQACKAAGVVKIAGVRAPKPREAPPSALLLTELEWHRRRLAKQQLEDDEAMARKLNNVSIHW